ncbi:MAG: winged helix-turn-helix domain-containing protein [Candidatus Brockarchaeota archaeon]|nr:winged helix-turn-helix domain-containing protein [Candidatus Brockarchaeota archaeon]
MGRVQSFQSDSAGACAGDPVPVELGASQLSELSSRLGIGVETVSRLLQDLSRINAVGEKDGKWMSCPHIHEAGYPSGFRENMEARCEARGGDNGDGVEA